MRSFKIATLFLLAGTLSVACNDGGDDGEGGGVGAGSNGSGGSTAATGGGSGDGDGDGDVTPAGCGTVTVATGKPAMIDDFNSGSAPNFPDDSDGRVGTWTHNSNLNTAGEAPSFPSEGMGGSASYLEASCVAKDVDTPQCNQAWKESAPWEQWAGIETLFGSYVDPAEGEPNCYDASVFTGGIKFKAKSGNGADKIRLQFGTPDSDSTTGETYQSPEITLTGNWEEYEVSFADIKQPTWSSVKAPLNVKALISMTFAVRTRTDQLDGDDMVVGEVVDPYNIQIDDVSFY